MKPTGVTPMNGTQPSKHIIVRSFRGQQLVLVTAARAAKYFHWSADRSKALKLDMSEAIGLADKAAREYGANCAVLDERGALAQPAAARMNRTPADPAELAECSKCFKLGYLCDYCSKTPEQQEAHQVAQMNGDQLAEPGRYTHRITRNGHLCSEHKSLANANRARDRYVKMSNGKLTVDAYVIEPV